MNADIPDSSTMKRAALDVVWLWYSKRKREIHLSFMNPMPDAAEFTLRFDDVPLPLQVDRSSTSLTFTNVDISSAKSQVVVASIVL